MAGARQSQDVRPRCGRHPAAGAGWLCTGCGARLCPDCVATRSAGTSSSYAVCVGCGAAANVIMASRTALRPFHERLFHAPGFPVTRSALVSLVLLAGFRTLLSYRGFAPLPAQAAVAGASLGAFWAYIFYIIRQTATGRPGLGVPDFRDVKEDLFVPAAKGAAATALIWAPTALYLLLTNGWDLGVLSAPEKVNDPVIWLLVLAGIAYCPMALVAAATDIELLGILNPLQVVRYIWKAGRDYAITVAAIAVMAVPGAIIQVVVVPLLRALPVPFFCRWLAEAAALYVPFVMARMLGTLLHVHGDALDWGVASDYDDPVLPDARPRGTPPPPRPAPPPLEVESAPVEETAAEEISRALAAQDLPRAVALYEAAGRLPPQALAPEQHFAVGRAAANAGQFPVAVRALKAAAYSPDAIAPRALVTLARVYGEGMHDPDSAQRLLHETVKRYPDSDAAAFARQRLGA
jgi:hypothetical protein